MIRVVDNIIGNKYADAIEYDCRHMLQYAYMNKTSTTHKNNEYIGELFVDDNTRDYGQLTCPILNGQDPTMYRYWWDTLKSLFYSIQDNLPEFEIESVSRVKVNILTKQADAPENHYNIAHPDSALSTEYTAIYYVNDSDGDTFIFNEVQPQEMLHRPKQLTIQHRITPKKNSILVFPSNQWHASSNPRVSTDRIVINIVFTVRGVHVIS